MELPCPAPCRAVIQNPFKLYNFNELSNNKLTNTDLILTTLQSASSSALFIDTWWIAERLRAPEEISEVATDDVDGVGT